jgi:transposase-like protein
MARNPVRFVPYKDRKAVGEGLTKIYLAPPADLAACAPDGFAGVRDKKYPVIANSWRSRWNEVIPFFRFSPEIRKAVYTTNAIESVNAAYMPTRFKKSSNTGSRFRMTGQR